jgi:hypothetical protein
VAGLARALRDDFAARVASRSVADDLARYAPFVLGTLSASILIAKYPNFARLPKEHVRSMLFMFDAALVLYVALDLASGRALTSMTDLPRAASILVIAIAVLLLANVVYLFVRRRAPR